VGEFPDDFLIEWDGQTYEPIVTSGHETAAGKTIPVILWGTNCPSCGQRFTVTTTLTFRAPRRRCDDCKAPGRKVRTDRKLFRAQVRGDAP